MEYFAGLLQRTHLAPFFTLVSKGITLEETPSDSSFIISSQFFSPQKFVFINFLFFAAFLTIKKGQRCITMEYSSSAASAAKKSEFCVGCEK